MKRIFTRIGIVLLFLMSQHVFAAPGPLFNVVALEDAIEVSTTIHKYYPNVGIRINTAGYSLSGVGHDCTLINNGYCLFAASHVLKRRLTIQGSPGIVSVTLCLNGIGPISCQNHDVVLKSPPNPPTNPPFAYISTENSEVFSCPIGISGIVNLCSGNIFDVPRGIAVNNAGDIAYIVENAPDTVSVCHIQPDGFFSSCIDSGRTGVGFSGPEGIALNPAGKLAYVTNVTSNSVTVCPIKFDGTFGICEDAGGQSGFGFVHPSGIVINELNTIAYVVNTGTSAVHRCPIMIDGRFGDCVPESQPFNFPVDVALNSVGNHLYVTDIGNDRVSVCSLLPDGAFNTCQFVAAPGTFNSPFGIAINAGDDTAYVANGGSHVSQCGINPDGTFSTCIDVFGSVTWPVFIALRD